MIIANKVAEKDIRNYLSCNGYFGRSAKFEELELHAIQRPGWLQVFRFKVKAKNVDDQWKLLFGAMKDDERFKLCEIELFENLNRRNHVLDHWSEGLMQPKFKSDLNQEFSKTRYFRELAIFVVGFALLLGLLAMLGA